MNKTELSVFKIAAVMTVLIALSSTSAMAFCIIRDTGNLEIPAGSGLYCQDCCAGNPRVWQAGDQPVPIDILNTTAADIQTDIRDAHDEWTDIDSATFSFSNGGTTTIDTRTNDGTNVVGFDPNYCTSRGNCGQNILASSGCNSEDSGSSSYHAVDCDIFFNAEEYNWGHDPGDRDPFRTCLHELGHNVGLIHPSDTPQSSGSRGCGPDSPDATMWRSDHGGTGSLELDDVAGITSIYPEWRYRVKVSRRDSSPISGATVIMNNTCFGHDGTDYLEGGQVYGDIDFCQIGNSAASDTYDPDTDYTTDATGYTPYMRVLDNSYCFWVERAGFDTFYGCVTLPSPGNWQTGIELDDTDKRDIRASLDLNASHDLIVGGDLRVKGTMYSKGLLSSTTATGKDGDRFVSANLSTRPTVVQRGTGRLAGGQTRVNLAPALMARMATAEASGFNVRLTATAECNGLYVSEKGANYFVVTESDEGSSEATFNWEVAVSRMLPNYSAPLEKK